MGELVAVRRKDNGDATESALAMLRALTIKKVDKYGIASAKTININNHLQQLQEQKLLSPTVIGYAFSKILEHDTPQPLGADNASLVFDGRIIPPDSQQSDVQAFLRNLSGNTEKSVKTFIRKFRGDFALVIAETERLVVARDTLGVRPLYYGENGFLAAIASQRKALWEIGIKKANSFSPGHVAVANRSGFTLNLAKKLAYSEPKPVSMKAAAQKLQNLLQEAVWQRLSGLKEVAVPFSGGLDSGIIAYLSKKQGVNVHLIHVSLRNQSETEHAKAAAEELRLPIEVCTHSEDGVSQLLPLVLTIIEEPDAIKASIGIPFYWAAEKAARMKLHVMLAGQGSDELFAGYRRYVDCYMKWGDEKTRLEIFRDVINMHETNFERDFKICSFHAIEMRLPFADYNVVRFALDLPLELKIQPTDKTLRKLVLRQAASNLGLPRTISDRPKKAVQYASGVNRALRQLANQKGLTLEEFVQRTFKGISKRGDD